MSKYLVIDEEGTSSPHGPAKTLKEAWNDYLENVDDDANIDSVTFYEVKELKVEIEIKEVATPVEINPQAKGKKCA